jgi:hypothetical protein
LVNFRNFASNFDNYAKFNTLGYALRYFSFILGHRFYGLDTDFYLVIQTDLFCIYLIINNNTFC